LVSLYRSGLADLPLELPPAGDANHEPAWHLFVVKSDRRDELQAFLKTHEIQSALHYPRPIYSQPAYRFLKYTDRLLPETASVMSKILSLPLYPELKDAEVRRVCKVIRQFYAAKR
jgi:dTDP-4-amino-4,6-dideoxygalactose transaminase